VLPEVARKVPLEVTISTCRAASALFAPGIEVPLVPFMGIMAVMPPEASQHAAALILGGNWISIRLTVGARLYLPVHQRGALSIGGFAPVQATAISTAPRSRSLTPSLRIHRTKSSAKRDGAAAPNAPHYVMG